MSTNRIGPNMTLRQLLCAIPQCTPVLECFGVNLTGDRGKTLTELSELRKLDGCTVIRMLAAMRDVRQQTTVVCIELMTLTELCDHLGFVHRNIQDELKRVHQLVKQALREGGSADRQVVEFEEKFEAFRFDLTKHLQKEAAELVPIICRLVMGDSGHFSSASEFGKHIRKFEREHIQVDDELAELATFTVNKTWREPLKTRVERFISAITTLNQTLQEQIYAENAVLFPRLLGSASAL